MIKDKLGTRGLLEEILLRSYTELLSRHRMEVYNNDNVFVREVKGLHRNVTKNDLPDHVRKALDSVTESMLGFIQANGFQLTPKN